MPSFTIGHKRNRDCLVGTRSLLRPLRQRPDRKPDRRPDRRLFRSSHIDRVMGLLRVPNHTHIVGIHPVAHAVDGLDEIIHIDRLEFLAKASDVRLDGEFIR